MPIVYRTNFGPQSTVYTRIQLIQQDKSKAEARVAYDEIKIDPEEVPGLIVPVYEHKDNTFFFKIPKRCNFYTNKCWLIEVKFIVKYNVNGVCPGIAKCVTFKFPIIIKED